MSNSEVGFNESQESEDETKPVTHEEMFSAACRRPKNYYDLTLEECLKVDEDLGILDWEGPRSEEELEILSKIFNVIMKK